MITSRYRTIALLFVVLSGSSVRAASLTVSDAWMRALPNHLPAAGYFTLHNTGGEVRLTDARSPACGMLMLHRSASENGMASMMDVENVVVPSRGTVKFTPGGLHLMCTDPKPSLRPGANVPVTLQFSDGKSMTANFPVRNAVGR